MKTAMVTGASSGVGLELTRRLLAEGWRVETLTRSEVPLDGPTEAARHEGRLVGRTADLADEAARARALQMIAADPAPLDVLFNVAGVSLGAPALSPQGRDIHFEVNTLAPFIVTMQLQARLLRSAGRTIINASSNAALMVKAFEPAELERPKSFRKLLGPYASSKLALSLWTEAVAPRLARDGLRLLSVCPGANKTPMTAGDGMPWWLMPSRHLLFSHPRVGAARLWDAAFASPSARTGAFLVKGKPKAVPFAERADEVLALMENAAAGAVSNEESSLRRGAAFGSSTFER